MLKKAQIFGLVAGMCATFMLVAHSQSSSASVDSQKNKLLGIRNDRAQTPNKLRLAQRSCWRRMGPFATQMTAWQRLRTARDLGVAVSNGIYPCYVGARGYCFNVFYSC